MPFNVEYATSIDSSTSLPLGTGTNQTRIIDMKKTRNTPREMIDIIIGFAKKKPVQRQLNTGAWANDPRPSFNFGIVKYRLRPTLVEGWCGVYNTPPQLRGASYIYPTEEAARDRCNKADRIVFMREVE